jgi:phosphohistidine phosphatase
MKSVLLLRHGKSKRGPDYPADFERPLAKRGKRDAERMGLFLVENDYVPDLIVSSPAERASDTALRCAETADYIGEIRFDETLYYEEDDAYLELLWGLDDDLSLVMIVGHNPTIASVIETLSGVFARMPTAALARIDLAIDEWSALEEGKGRLVWVQLPRELD